MPKKGKKGKKAAAEEAARLEAEQKAKEAEEKRRFEEQLVAREQALLAREEQIAKREQDAQALETDFRSKLEGLDAEVTLRARSGIAAAEAREAATERRAKMREEEAAQREAVFREAETTMAVREVEVAAREAAMGENVIGGVAARLDAMLSDQAISRDQMTQRKKEIAKEREALKLREQAWRDEVLKMEATLAQKERDARGRVEREERKLMQKDFTLKRRLARRVKEASAIVQAHRAECDVRDRRLRVREEEIRRRNTDLVYLLRRARKYEATAKRTQQRANLDPATVDVEDAPWERPQTAPLRRSVTPEINPELDDLELRATQGLETYGDEVPDANEIKSPTNLYRPPTNPAEKFTDFKKLPEPSIPADEFKAVLKRVQGMEDELAQELLGHTGADPDDEADAVAAALKDVQAAERLVLAAEGLSASPTKSRPYAARNLDAALGPAPAPFSLDDDGPVGFDLPDFAVEA
jgi:hypothetical protein